MFQQQVPIEPTLIKGIERMNVVIARLQQQGAESRNPYAMDVDRSQNRNCYACGDFGHIAKNYRNRGIGVNRRIEQVEDNNSNLNGDGGLMGPN